MKNNNDTKYYCKKMNENDIEKVMHWRMLPYVTQYMNTDPILTFEDQLRWYKILSAEDNFYYWIIYVNDTPCGVLNLSDIDTVNKHCKWGYYIAEKNFRSFTLSFALECSLYDYVFDKIKLNKISGESFCINEIAIKLHELCGCKTEGILRQHVFKKGNYYDICVQSMLAEEWGRIRDKMKYKNVIFINTPPPPNYIITNLIFYIRFSLCCELNN